MISESKRRSLVAKLLRLTYDGKLDWSMVKAPDSVSHDDLLMSAVFQAQVDELVFRIYEIRRYRTMFEEHKGHKIGRGFKVWESRFILDVADARSSLSIDSLTDNDGLPTLENLFDAARNSVSDIDRRIDAFLERDLTHASG